MADRTESSTRSSDDQGNPTGSGASRRSVLRAAGLLALAGGGAAALAACSPDQTATQGTSDNSPTTAVTPSSSASESSSPSSSSSASSEPSSSPSSAAPSGPSVPVSEVPVGGGFIMPDGKYVVTQPEKGTFKAFSKICTHQGCPVSQIANQEIVCRCHNSHFSITDGSVQSGPAKAPLAAAKATVSGSNVVVSA